MSWQIDTSHTEIGFSVRHMMISKVRGQFQDFSGSVTFDPNTLETTSANLTIQTNSINTRNEDRDNHLKSADFFDAATYPTITFNSTHVEKISDNKGRLIGDLTIKDVTKSVELDVEYFGTAQSPWGTTSAGFAINGKINRKAFGLTWNQTLETGGVLVGEDVTLAIEVELAKQPEAQPA